MRDVNELKQALAAGKRPRMNYSWGESLWQTIYTSVLNHQSNTRGLIDMLPSIMTCGVCRAHLKSYVGKHPMPSDPADLFQWVYELEKSVSPSRAKDRFADIVADPRKTQPALMPPKRRNKAPIRLVPGKKAGKKKVATRREKRRARIARRKKRQANRIKALKRGMELRKGCASCRNK